MVPIDRSRKDGEDGGVRFDGGEAVAAVVAAQGGGGVGFVEDKM